MVVPLVPSAPLMPHVCVCVCVERAGCAARAACAACAASACVYCAARAALVCFGCDNRVAVVCADRAALVYADCAYNSVLIHNTRTRSVARISPGAIIPPSHARNFNMQSLFPLNPSQSAPVHILSHTRQVARPRPDTACHGPISPRSAAAPKTAQFRNCISANSEQTFFRSEIAVM